MILRPDTDVEGLTGAVDVVTGLGKTAVDSGIVLTGSFIY